MQSRFTLRQKKRVFRMLSHPRFRAAFDFLELRAKVAPELAADLLFWREAQLQVSGVTVDGSDSAEDFESEGVEDLGVASVPPPRRRGRRRPRGSGTPAQT